MTHKINIYPHNDLLNLAHYHRSVINGKIERGEQDALSLDCMSCIVALAFGVEAFINFVGINKVENWDESQSFKNKIKHTYRAVGGVFDKDNDPYTTVWHLKEIRDSMAHGKPIENSVSLSSHQELWAEMRPPWDHYLNQEYINQAYTQVKAWQTELLELSDIPLDLTITAARRVSK